MKFFEILKKIKDLRKEKLWKEQCLRELIETYGFPRKNDNFVRSGINSPDEIYAKYIDKCDKYKNEILNIAGEIEYKLSQIQEFLNKLSDTERDVVEKRLINKKDRTPTWKELATRETSERTLQRNYSKAIKQLEEMEIL